MSRPTIAWISCCVVVAAVGAVETWRPSRITVTRWQSAKTSSSRCEMKSTAAPWARSVSTTRKRRSTSVERQRRGRLVHHDHARLRRERLRDLDDLLVGDREPARDAVGVELDAELRRTARSTSRRMRRRSMRRPLRSGCAPMKTFSATVRSGKSVGSWKMIAMPGRVRLRGRVEDDLLAVHAARARCRAGARRRGS